MKRPYRFLLFSLVLSLSASTREQNPPIGTLVAAQEVEEGAGAKVFRLFPGAGMRHLDPFVIFDDFNLQLPAGFPDHMHKGFEAVTYMREGGFRHRDNLGNDGIIRAGSVQRFTAGSGIVHSEMPTEQGANRGFQLWINLPDSLKALPAAYQQAEAAQLPVKKVKGGTLCTIIGPGSPITLHAEVLYQELTLDSGQVYEPKLPLTYQGYFYVYEGAAQVNGTSVLAHQALLVNGTKTWSILANKDCGILLITGKPHGSPIRQRGPFVY